LTTCSGTIVLWGLAEDPPLAALRAALERRGTSYRFLDQRSALTTRLGLSVGAAVDGMITCPDQRICLGDVSALYVRPHDSRRLARVADRPEDAEAHALDLDDALYGWAELTRALVVNRPSAMASNTSKPYQAQIIRASGLATPETIITTDPAAARAFWQRHGAVIYKSVSGVRSIVAKLNDGHATRLDDVAWCPTQFQRWIPGIDYRVHVIDADVFASRIESDADDYRYAARHGHQLAITAAELPPGIAAACIRLTRALGLAISGIDLRRDPDDVWWCFEANPSPGFSFYEEITGQPIADALAALLERGPPASDLGPAHADLDVRPAAYGSHR
jgi:hypothetical protein